LITVLFFLAMLSYGVLTMQSYARLSQHSRAHALLAKTLRERNEHALQEAMAHLTTCVIALPHRLSDDVLWWQHHACVDNQAYYVVEVLQETSVATYYRVISYAVSGVARNRQQMIYEEERGGAIRKVAWRALADSSL
jgi:hypothetical protein